MASILVDTGIWLALCDPKDDSVPRAVIEDIYERIKVHTVVVPWPIAYETLRTRFVRKNMALQRFERELKKPFVRILDDEPYRKDALELSFDSSLRQSRPLSMVDCVIRLLLEDVRTRINFLATFNERDFHDVCRRRQVELWSR